MSSRTIRSSSPNSASASARASSVLPTPVGPRNRKLPTGRSGSASPARERRTASATTLTASSWPTTRSCRCPSRRSSRSRSSSVSWLTGMPVARDTTSAMSATVTSGTAGVAAGRRRSISLLQLAGSRRAAPTPARTARRRPPGPCPGAAAPAGAPGRAASAPGVFDPQPHPRAGLVDQVDRLVRQEPVGDVAVGQLGRGDQRLVGEPDLVVGLVAVAQPAQDRDGVLDGRLGHQDRLEAAGQRGVRLDVPAVLVQRGRADHPQLRRGPGPA